MKKARIVLSIIALLSIAGGTLAFKAARFNGNPIWQPTDVLTTKARGKTFAVYGNLYTSTGATLFFSTAGQPAIVFKTTTSIPPFYVIATATDGSGDTYSIRTYGATLTLTLVTTVN